MLAQERRNVGAEQLEAASHPGSVVRGKRGGGGGWGGEGMAAKNAKRRKEEQGVAEPHRDWSATGPRSQRVIREGCVGERGTGSPCGAAAGGDRPRAERVAARDRSESWQRKRHSEIGRVQLHNLRGALSFAMRKSSIFGCFTSGAPG
ncbi:hypothetical protein LBMAG56_00370 [Verrucomicrobiota bacterium]|nr:hypothetical protein LBMAG56_00370 [Verrucomicrobiota bacterium]